jgi:hypothetical protein
MNGEDCPTQREARVDSALHHDLLGGDGLARTQTDRRALVEFYRKVHPPGRAGGGFALMPELYEGSTSALGQYSARAGGLDAVLCRYLVRALRNRKFLLRPNRPGLGVDRIFRGDGGGFDPGSPGALEAAEKVVGGEKAR